MNNFLTQLTTALKSRTFWTIVVVFALNTVQVYGHYFQPDFMTLLNGILGALAVYFKITPSQQY